MKSIITNYRYWVLALLVSIVSIGIVAVPQDNIGFWSYIALFLASKVVALVALIACDILYLHWNGNHKIPELAELIEEE